MLSGITDDGLENKLKQTKQVRKIQYQVKLLNCLFWPVLLERWEHAMWTLLRQLAWPSSLVFSGSAP